MDGRIITRPGSGIATYAAALRRAQQCISRQALLVRDASCTASPGDIHPAARMARWIKAATNSSVLMNYCQPSPEEYFLHANDIYRLAQVRFRQTGRLLTLRAPGSPAIIHWSLPVPIRIANWINIYTFHDVIPLSHPTLTPMESDRHRTLLRKLTATADHIVTVSNDARDTILCALDCAPSFVTNCSIAVEPSAPSDSPLPQPLVPKAYMLFVGSDDARKNVARLVAAYRKSGIALPLLLVGPHDIHADPAARIFCLPRQEAGRLSSLIAQARALLLPSLAEGFGLPIVEAMALGTGTMTSNRGALAEIAGEAALQVDPGDIESIAHGLSVLATDDGVEATLVARGRTRAALYSHEHFTRRLSDLYGSLLPRLTDRR